MGFLFALVTAVVAASSTSIVNGQCTPLGDSAAAAGLTSLVDAVGLVADLPDAEDLLTAVTATEPVETPITLFAPSNEAFEEIADVVAGLDAETVLAVLGNHIVPIELSSTAIIEAISDAMPEPATAPTALGTTLEATLEGEELIVTPTGTDIMATVIAADVETCAGIVHVIDAVLVPVPAEEEMPSGEYGAAGAYGAY